MHQVYVMGSYTHIHRAQFQFSLELAVGQNSKAVALNWSAPSDLFCGVCVVLKVGNGAVVLCH